MWEVFYEKSLDFLSVRSVLLVSHLFILSFFSLICLLSIGIILAFTIPRVPSFALNSTTPLANATGSWAKAVPTIFSRVPANFSFPAFAALQVNTGSNFLPLNFQHLRASVFDLQTNRLVGTGDLNHLKLPANAFPDILLPLNFTYFTTNDTDQTCKLANGTVFLSF